MEEQNNPPVGGQKGKGRIDIRKNGIIYVEVDEAIQEGEFMALFEKIKERTRSFPKKPKILIVNLVIDSVLRSYVLRKKVGDKFKELVFEKAAIYEDNVFSRTVASFIVAVSGLENVRVFVSKEKALKWLKN